MAVDPFADWYPNLVKVRRFTGTSPTTGADSYAAEVPLMMQVEETVAMTRDSAGEEVTSTVTMIGDVSLADQFNAGALVSLPWSQHPDTVVLSVSVVRFGTALDGVTVMCE